MYGKGTLEKVTINGHGIIDSGHQKWQHPSKGLLSNIIFENGYNIEIERFDAEHQIIGITFCKFNINGKQIGNETDMN